MKLTHILPVLMVLAGFASCKKDKPEDPTPTTIYPDYSPMKVGNYWIYQRFRVDTLGNVTPQNKYDSCYIAKDTLIRGNSYAKMMRPNPFNPKYQSSYLRDSLHYIIDDKGEIHFSSEDFNSVLYSEYFLAAGLQDTLFHISRKMTDKEVTNIVPAGTFESSNAKATITVGKNFASGPNPRYMDYRYAKNVGLIKETLPAIISDPNDTERLLIRYHLNP